MNIETLIESIKRSITIPSYQARFQDQDLIDLANEEQESTIVPMITSLQENFFLTYEDVSVAASTQSVQIPYRAAGRSVVAIYSKKDDGSLIPLTKYEVTDMHLWNTGDAASPYGFYIMGDCINLVPVPSKAVVIRFIYPAYPSTLVLDRSNTILSVTNAVGGSYVTATATIVNTISIGDTVDITQYRPGYKIVYKDALVSNISNNLLYLNGYNDVTPLTGIVANDGVSLSNETCIVQLPNEATQCLIHAVAIRVLQAMKIDSPETMEVYMRKVEACKRALSPRVDGSPSKIINRNGLLNGRNIRRFPSLKV